MAWPPLAALSIFMGLVLVLALYGLTVSGHFPAEFRDPSLKTTFGKTVLWATLVVACLLVIVAIAIAWRSLPLYATILAAGAMVLVAPLLLRPFPDRFVNGRGGLLAFAAIGVALALLASNASLE
jgi:hypothetical protein